MHRLRLIDKKPRNNQLLCMSRSAQNVFFPTRLHTVNCQIQTSRRSLLFLQRLRSSWSLRRFPHTSTTPGTFGRQASMKYPALILVFLLFACGCATHHSGPKAKEIPDKQEELKVLCAELRLAALQLDNLQRDLTASGLYSAADQTRDLDYSISTIQQARNRLTAKYWKLVNEYHHDWHGPF
jgi:hypothetical protein